MNIHSRTTPSNINFQPYIPPLSHNFTEGANDGLQAWEMLSLPFEVCRSSSKNIFFVDSKYSPKVLFLKSLVKVLFLTSNLFCFMGFKRASRFLNSYKLHIQSKQDFLNINFVQATLHILFEKAVRDLKAVDTDETKTSFEKIFICQELLGNYCFDIFEVYSRCSEHFDLKGSLE